MNKQYIYTWTVSMILIVCLSACERFITYDDPTATTDEQWWKTDANAQAALSTVYTSVPFGTWNGVVTAKNVMAITTLTDDGVSRQDYRGGYSQYALGIHNTDWDVSEHLWLVNYRDIRRANRFLANIDRTFFQDNSFRERYRNEARALRAYYHLELLMYFGAVPIVTDVIPASNNTRPRNTIDEVYQFVVSELKTSAENLPVTYTTEGDVFRMSKGACWALISRLALYFKKYDQARDAALQVINLNKYQLHPNYSTLFTYAGEINNERIMIKLNGAVNAWQVLAPAGVAGEPTIFPTASLIDSYETRQGKMISELSADSISYYQRNPAYNRDPRMQATVLVPGQIIGGVTLSPFNMSSTNPDRIGRDYSTATGFWVNKYLDIRDRTSTRSLDFMVMRYAEVLLNYAEALVELNNWQDPEVVKYLNQIRSRAGMPNIDAARYNGRFTGSQEEMRQFVRRERRIELAFEGQRYFDIRRWGTANTAINGPVFGAFNPVTNQPEPIEVRLYRPNRDYLWPIPTKEMLTNPNMLQNPNYN